MTGDLSIGADGTVTYIDGNRIYAFGHRFLAVGSTALPFTRSEVLALLPVMSASFKISAPKETMGAILQDRNTAIAGELGRAAAMAPISISVSRGGKRLDNYQMEMVNDRFLSPLLVQMAVFNTIDATERTVGASSFRVTGEIEFQGSAAPLKVNNMYAADTGSAMIASLSTAIPLAYVLQSGFDALEVKKVALDIESFDAKKQFEIDSVSVGRREVRAGGKVELTTMLVGENGAEVAAHDRIPGPAGHHSRAALLHGGRRHDHQSHGVPPDHRRPAEIDLATDLDRQQPARQYQGLRARVASGARLSVGRSGFPRPAAFGGHDPGRLAERARQHHPDAQFQAGGTGDRSRRQCHQWIEDDSGGGEGMRSASPRRPVAVSPRRCLVLLFLATPALPSATTAWEMTSYQDFIRGQFQGVSLSRDGRLTLAPKVDTLFSSGQAVVWSVAEGANGVLYVATGHRGRVYQVDPSGKSSLLWTAEQPEVFAIATDRNGVLYAGTSPDGKVYRIEGKQRQSHRVLRAQDPLYLVAGSRPRWRALRGHRRSGQDLPRHIRGLGRAVLRYRPIARDRPGRGCARPPAGGHRAERHSLSRIGQGQGLRAVRRQPARDPRHHSAAGWHRLCGRAGRLAGQARAGCHAGLSVRDGERSHRAGRAPIGYRGSAGHAARSRNQDRRRIPSNRPSPLPRRR